MSPAALHEGELGTVTDEELQDWGLMEKSALKVCSYANIHTHTHVVHPPKHNVADRFIYSYTYIHTYVYTTGARTVLVPQERIPTHPVVGHVAGVAEGT
jgi:hypothetical protein